MGSLQSTRRKSGFTLVELLIVAIILAILAAIIIPQFASTTTDAQESALRADVAAMRAAISLYRQQHGVYPGAVAATGGTCTGGVAGLGVINTQVAIQDQLTRYTNAAGQSCTLPGTGANTFPFGPYLQLDVLPENPITGSNVIAIVTTGNLVMTAGSGLGWQYDTVAGKFIINDSTLDSTGVAYSSY